MCEGATDPSWIVITFQQQHNLVIEIFADVCDESCDFQNGGLPTGVQVFLISGSCII